MADRSRTMVAALAGVVLLAGCGGSARPSTTAAAPRIPHALGVALAARADRVASALERGDECTAAAQADRLNVAVGNAVSSGAIPARLQAPAVAAAARLASSIVCRPPTTTAADTTTAATTTLSACDQLAARKQQLDDEKQALDQEKKTDKGLKGEAKKARDKEIDARRHAIDQAEHALDQQAHAAGCH